MLFQLSLRSALPGNLHPLAVFVPLPVRHARLAAALLKSMVLLKWLPNGAAPRLSDDTISQHVIQVCGFGRAAVPCSRAPLHVQQLLFDLWQRQRQRMCHAHGLLVQAR